MSTTGERTLNDRMTAMEIAFASMSATLGTKLDALILAVGTQHSDHEARLRALEVQPVPDPTHESRLQRLERAWWMVAGAALVIGGGAGGAVSAIFGG